MESGPLRGAPRESNPVRLRTQAWYGDRPLTLPLPPSWHVRLFELGRRAPLTDAEIAARLEAPVGQPAIRELARGKRHPAVIVDDLNRPTPAARVLGPLLRQFADAGIPPRDVSIVMATATHGPSPGDALAKKVGGEAESTCNGHVHDCHRGVTKIGTTSFGTPVLVNDHVVVGIGGVYPNTAGFGGGSKLALGVLGFRSIASLHGGHDGMGWGTPNDRSNFRRDLDEIASMIGLRTTCSLLLNGDLDVVDLVSGDYRLYYAEVLQAAKEAYGGPAPPANAKVVLVNAYPADLSLTFTRIKGMTPLARAPRDASRAVISPCLEGHGFHGLFPFLNAPLFHRQRRAAIRAGLELREPRKLPRKIGGRLLRRLLPGRRAEAISRPAWPIWLYWPETAGAPHLPVHIPGMEVRSSWGAIVEAVQREQAGEDGLEVAVYSCAGLLWLT